MNPRSNEPWSRGKLLLLLLVTWVGIRSAVLVWGWKDLNADPDAYRTLASTWHDHGVLGLPLPDGGARPTAYRPPLYPWILSWWCSPSAPYDDRYGIALLHLGLGVATCGLTVGLGHRLGLSAAGAIVAGLLVALDPILLRQSTLVMTETLATFLAVGVWWLGMSLDRGHGGGEKNAEGARGWGRWSAAPSMAFGAAMGLAILCRPTALAWLALWWAIALAGGAILAARGASPRRGARGSLFWATMACGLVLVPWGIRNRMQLDRWTVATTHGGYTLYLANNPILYQHWKRSVSREWDEESFHALWRSQRSDAIPSENFTDTGRVVDECRVDDLANSLALRTIWSQPQVFVWGCGVRWGWLWAWWPSERQAGREIQWGVGIWYGMVCSLAILGFLRVGRPSEGMWGPANDLWDRWRPWTLGVLLVVSLSLVHSVYWSNMRMRAPAVPVVSLLAGVAVGGRKKPPASKTYGESGPSEGGRQRDFLTIPGQPVG